MQQAHRLNRLLVGLLSLIALSSVFSHPDLPARAETPTPPQTVASVDLDRYTGKWYEIAAMPMVFERKCVANATAEYTRLATGEMSVFNSCTQANGQRQSAAGQAKVVDPKTNAKLEVSFLSLPFFGWQYWTAGDYWILWLAPDYSTAIVGDSTRKYGWILSRTPKLPMDTLKSLAKTITDRGYNACDFIITPQTGGLAIKQPLCTAISGTSESDTKAPPEPSKTAKPSQ